MRAETDVDLPNEQRKRAVNALGVLAMWARQDKANGKAWMRTRSRRRCCR
ncbi:MAG: hypothetical protein QM811_29735 [Pirellulales bacterium]